MTVTVKLSLWDNISPKQCSAVGEESIPKESIFPLEQGLLMFKDSSNCGSSSSSVQHVSVWDTLTKIQGDVVQYSSRIQVLSLQSSL